MSKNQYRFFCGTVSVVVLLLLAGCKQNPTNSTPGKISPFGNLRWDAISMSGIDTTLPDAFVRLSAIKNYNDQGTTNTIMNAVADACFANDSTIVTPTSVLANGYSLVRSYGGPVYANQDYHVYNSSQTIWNVTGYESGTFKDTVTFPSALSITNHGAGDTVSKAGGFTLNYSGSAGGTLIVMGRFDPGFTSLWKDSASAFSGEGMLGKFVSDNGVVTITSTDLSNFTTARYITIEICHFEYHVRNSSTGRKVGVISSYSDYIPLYLGS